MSGAPRAPTLFPSTPLSQPPASAFIALRRIAEIKLLRPRNRATAVRAGRSYRSEEHTSELQSRLHIVCRLLLEKKKQQKTVQFVRSDSAHPKRISSNFRPPS